MTREELIRVIENSEEKVTCPKVYCHEFSWIYGSFKTDGCFKCAEKQLSEYEKQIRDEVIDELTQEVEFEEKWLFDCYKEMGCRYTRRDVDIAFSGIKHYLNKLKGE